MALEPEIQRIMLRDGPAVLGDPSQWPSQNVCLGKTIEGLQGLIDAGIIKQVDTEATARLLNGAALNAAMWIASADNPKMVFGKAVDAFTQLANGKWPAAHDKIKNSFFSAGLVARQARQQASVYSLPLLLVIAPGPAVVAADRIIWADMMSPPG